MTGTAILPHKWLLLEQTVKFGGGVPLVTVGKPQYISEAEETDALFALENVIIADGLCLDIALLNNSATPSAVPNWR